MGLGVKRLETEPTEWLRFIADAGDDADNYIDVKILVENPYLIIPAHFAQRPKRSSAIDCCGFTTCLKMSCHGTRFRARRFIGIK
jgi:hypothetical protein